MHNLQLKAHKMIEKLQVVHDTDGTVPDYFHVSEDTNNTLSISVFLGEFDWYRGYIGYKTFGDNGGSVSIHNPIDISNLQYIQNSPFIIASKIISIDVFNSIYNLAKQNNSILIYDLDDNLHELPNNNKAKSYFDSNHLSNLELMLSKSDHVIYSTRELLSYYKKTNPNCSYYPNFIDFDRYKVDPIDWKDLASKQYCDFDDETLIIGFFGSDSHIEDMEILRESITKIINNHNVLLAIMSSSDLIAHCIIRDWGLPSNKFLFIPFKNIYDYPKYISMFDIGLAPLKNNLFNISKSNLKLLEYGALKIPYVASLISNYQRFNIESNGVGGFLCDNNKSWYESIEFLINNPIKRNKMGNQLHEYVYNQYDVKQSMVLLSDTLRTIYKNHNQVIKKPNYFELADSYDGIPHVKNKYEIDDICPCGSNEKYINCKNHCYPAWGIIEKE